MEANLVCKQLSDNLRYLRFKTQLSQQGVAEQLNITRARYSKYEEGASEPPYWLLLEISLYYDTSIDDLLKKDLRKLKYGSKTED